MCYRLPSVGAIWAHGVPCKKKNPKPRPATLFGEKNTYTHTIRKETYFAPTAL